MAICFLSVIIYRKYFTTMFLTGVDMWKLSAIVVRSSAHDRGKFVSVHYFNVIKVDSETVEYVRQMCKEMSIHEMCATVPLMHVCSYLESINF